MSKKNRKAPPAWTPFERATHTVMGPAAARAFKAAQAAGMKPGVIWLNSRYQVEMKEIPSAHENGFRLWHLSIKRLDKAAVGVERFRDFQRIKNELVGEECEAMELYPAESRLVDSSNQYHLWVFEGREEGDTPFGFGFGERLIVTGHPGGVGESRQLPFEPGTEPEDALTIEEAQELSVQSPVDPGVGGERCHGCGSREELRYPATDEEAVALSDDKHCERCWASVQP